MPRQATFAQRRDVAERTHRNQACYAVLRVLPDSGTHRHTVVVAY
ncbi:hypothetical protein ACTWPT_00025 [Nonomuraea sp. 3N208]